MQHPQNSARAAAEASGTENDPAGVVTPIGSYGTVTMVGRLDTSDVLLIARTYRGRCGWGVHLSNGDLLNSGWPTQARAITYADHYLLTLVGGAW